MQPIVRNVHIKDMYMIKNRIQGRGADGYNITTPTSIIALLPASHCRFYPTSHLPLRFSSSTSHLPLNFLPTSYLRNALFPPLLIESHSVAILWIGENVRQAVDFCRGPPPGILLFGSHLFTSESHTERANILFAFVDITDVNIHVRNWNDIFSNVYTSVKDF